MFSFYIILLMNGFIMPRFQPRPNEYGFLFSLKVIKSLTNILNCNRVIYKMLKKLVMVPESSLQF
uniref:Uncharacterized protein n=1 Tax=Octopus bimaculoides TaxID=37653 RepID=A0A0L8FWU8_OCTBM